MLKLMGSALFLTSGILLRGALLGKNRQELSLLRETIHAIETLQQRLYATLLPLPDLLSGLNSQKESLFFAEVCRRYQEDPDAGIDHAWQSASAEIPLDAGERETLEHLADSFSAPEELLHRSFLSALEQLRRSLDAKEAGREKEERVTTALCFSASIVLLVLVA